MRSPTIETRIMEEQGWILLLPTEIQLPHFQSVTQWCLPLLRPRTLLWLSNMESSKLSDEIAKELYGDGHDCSTSPKSRPNPCGCCRPTAVRDRKTKTNTVVLSRKVRKVLHCMPGQTRTLLTVSSNILIRHVLRPFLICVNYNDKNLTYWSAPWQSVPCHHRMLQTTMQKCWVVLP